MRALAVDLGTADSLKLVDVPDPIPEQGELLVEGLAVGICGTDREIVRGEFGVGTRLIIGHESLGRVVRAAGEFAVGDLIVGVVRRPDPEPCVACARGEFDMCRNGRYTERGITGLDGYASELWCVPPPYAVRLDSALENVGVLTEPTSVVVKAWEQVDRLARFPIESVLVTGAGPIGLLAALIGVQRGLDVHVVDRADSGPKPRLVRALGAKYHQKFDPALKPDAVIEATGAPRLAFDLMGHADVLCLTGVPSEEQFTVDGGSINRNLVLTNGIVFGTVNSNLRHYREAAEVLARADLSWLAGLITRRVPLETYEEAFEVRPDDVKVVVQLRMS